MFCVLTNVPQDGVVTNFGNRTAETRQAEVVPLVLVLVELRILPSKLRQRLVMDGK